MSNPFVPPSLVQIARGQSGVVVLTGHNRLHGGALQIYRGEEMIFLNMSYGNGVLRADEVPPDDWRVIGLATRHAEAGMVIRLYVPTTATPGSDYELRVATTNGSRSGPFVVI